MPDTLIIPTRPAVAPLPMPRVPVSVRVATMADVPFMDELQKKYGKALGYFPRKQFEGYVEMGAVLIAEEGASADCADSADEENSHLNLRPSAQSADNSPATLGYIIAKDRYLKRDELGVIFQLCVAPGMQRGLIGATLVKAAFERAAYGCRLFCCWCAQDLAANHFWESLGFVPLAFRAGSSGKKRVHIFWQRRIVEGDVETKWWYPFQTSSGAIREDRIVLPIPPGMHWSEVKVVQVARASSPCLPAPKKNTGKMPVPRGKNTGKMPVPLNKVGILVGGRIKYVDRPGYAGGVAPVVPEAGAKTEKPTRKAPAEKIDPKYLTAARELRDRYLEHVNATGNALLPAAKYEVTRQRQLSATAAPPPPAVLALPDAA